ncbi:MAG: PaaI family thioesterase [Caulobacterales bacterium]|nr:PaaI family thioesterase [Caulobacterales bacterium]
MTGLELMQAYQRGELKPASISGPMRFDLVEVGHGFCAFEGEPDASLLNPLGTVHGGWALTLIDSAAGCAAHTTLPASVGYTTVETHANFTRAIHPDSGTLRCEGRVLNAGRTLITAEATLKDSQGRIVAHGGSTLMVLQPR